MNAAFGVRFAAFFADFFAPDFAAFLAPPFFAAPFFAEDFLAPPFFAAPFFALFFAAMLFSWDGEQVLTLEKRCTTGRKIQSTLWRAIGKLLRFPSEFVLFSLCARPLRVCDARRDQSVRT